MSKEKAILLLEEKGYSEITTRNIFTWFGKKAESCNFEFCLKSYALFFHIISDDGHIRFNTGSLNYNCLSENNISSLEESAILSYKIMSRFRGFKYYRLNSVVRKERWRIRRVVSNNGFTHKFMLDAKYGIRWTKYKEITTQNIEELYALVTAL